MIVALILLIVALSLVIVYMSIMHAMTRRFESMQNDCAFVQRANHQRMRDIGLRIDGIESKLSNTATCQ